MVGLKEDWGTLAQYYGEPKGPDSQAFFETLNHFITNFDVRLSRVSLLYLDRLDPQLIVCAAAPLDDTESAKGQQAKEGSAREGRRGAEAKGGARTSSLTRPPTQSELQRTSNLPVSFVLRFSSVEGTGCGFGSCQARDQQGGRWRPRCAHRRHEEWSGVCQPSAPRPWWRSADGRPRRPDAGGSSGWRGPDDVRKPEEDGTQISHSFVAVCAVLATSTTCDTLSRSRPTFSSSLSLLVLLA